MAFFSKKRKIKKLKSSVDKIQNELVALSHQINSKTEEIDNLKEENEKLRSALSNSEQVREKLTSELLKKKNENADLTKELVEKRHFISSNGLEDAQQRIIFIGALNKAEEESQKRAYIADQKAKEAEAKQRHQENKIVDLEREIKTKESTLLKTREKTKRLKDYFSMLQKSEKSYFALSNDQLEIYNLPLLPDEAILTDLNPEAILKLNCMDQKALRKEFRENDKKIDELTLSYAARYTTKVNRALYQLMILALRAELQNILTKLKFGSLDTALDEVSSLCDKYIRIVTEGNQLVSKTLLRFILEIEELFKNAVRIEYHYYIEKERVRAEQAALREQMRQEAEERKELERQQKQMEKEESKFRSEIEKVEEQIKQEQDDEAIRLLQEKISQLETQLSGVEERKEEIVNRQNGKAGNVYVISNLGSFGENVFKVGMTRRLDPMDRVRELSSASVPFEFDVHAMIFSEDAVSLEKKLHTIMDEYRLNKVNLRKEFFKLPLDEIEKLVLQEDPAASFNRTMLALQYNQSISMKKESSNN